MQLQQHYKFGHPQLMTQPAPIPYIFTSITIAKWFNLRTVTSTLTSSNLFLVIFNEVPALGMDISETSTHSFHIFFFHMTSADTMGRHILQLILTSLPKKQICLVRKRTRTLKKVCEQRITDFPGKLIVIFWNNIDFFQCSRFPVCILGLMRENVHFLNIPTSPVIVQ